jgi:hypothetical protein
VSGDLIEGTITPKLLERQSRGLIDKRDKRSAPYLRWTSLRLPSFRPV